MKLQFKRFFSVDSPKAIKAKKFRYLNAINYMAPHKSGGMGNLCPHASPGCIALCLGRESGQASMVSAQPPIGRIASAIPASAKRATSCNSGKNIWWKCSTTSPPHAVPHKRKRIKLCVRPNGSTDVAYEGLRVMIMPSLAAELSKISGHEVTAGAHTIFSAFPNVQFVDYTKNPRRFERAVARKLQPHVFPLRDKRGRRHQNSRERPQCRSRIRWQYAGSLERLPRH